MIRSMTGYAALERCHFVAESHWTASWDLRSVNAKGLDLRLRLPDFLPGLAPAARRAISFNVGRGAITLTLKLMRSDGAGSQINTAVLTEALARTKRICDIAADHGMVLQMPTALDLLSLKGVSEAQELNATDSLALSQALQADLPDLISHFVSARVAEGQALVLVLSGQIEAIADLTAEALQSATNRLDRQKAHLSTALSRVLDNVEVSPERMLQELALLATKTDVTEELDRLQAHILNARELLNESKPIGRKFDFLCQEFNREANTLCAKSNDTDLTRVGLALKTQIEQLREQVQNVE